MFAALKSTVQILGLIWIGFSCQIFFGLSQYGIAPRDFTGLRGVFFSPLLHGNREHLVTNSLSFLAIAPFFFFISKRERGNFASLWFLSGLLTWVVGRPQSIHIGASSLIFSMIGFLMGVGLFRRNFKSISISVLAVLLYGGALKELLPTAAYISWEGHLSGFVAGIIIAKFSRPL